MKIAILHEMLIKLGGAEKVVSSFLDIFPDADIFTLIYDEKVTGGHFPKNKISHQCDSLMSQKVYNLTKRQRLCLPFMRQSVEKLDFSGYDIVIVSSSGFAHGMKIPHGCKSIVYYHAPARYLWDWTHEYRKSICKNSSAREILLASLLKNMRVWDYHAGQQHSYILANSKTTQNRLQKYYRRKAEILYPPIETQRFQTASRLSKQELEKLSSDIKRESLQDLTSFDFKNYYIVLSALTEFKRIEIAIENMIQVPETKLLIIGKGEYKETLQSLASKGDNIYFAGAQYGESLVHLVQHSLGLIFPGEEDFGIVPIEVMAAGKPVFALHKGGLTESVIAGKTGEFFYQEDGSDFIEHFSHFHNNNQQGVYLCEDCKTQAGKYDAALFQKKIKELL